MAKEKSPAFQFYVKDFLTGTMIFTAEEIGGYILLLCEQWDKGSVPNDDTTLMRIARVKPKSLAAIRTKFDLCEDGLLRNDKMERVRKAQEDWRKKCSIGGQHSAEVKRNKASSNSQVPLVVNGEVNGQGSLNKTSTLHSASSSSSANKASSSRSVENIFEIMRRGLPKEYSDGQIKREAQKLFDQYEGKPIMNLAALCNGWVAKLQPEPEKKTKFKSKEQLKREHEQRLAG